MRGKSVKIVLALAVIVCLLFPQWVLAADESQSSDMDYLKSVMDMIKQNYNGDVTDQQLLNGALKGMFGTMDPWTEFYTPQEEESFMNQMQGSYSGIGVEMSKLGDYITVMKVFAASPAEKAGLLPGDKIVSVDGKSIIGSSTDDVVAVILGKEGTKVTLGIIKAGQTDAADVEITRAEIKTNPVTYEIRDGIGYIRLDEFNMNAYDGIAAALGAMDKSKIDKIILDLRNNPGGEVTQAVEIARQFVPAGLITKLDFKSEDIKDTEYYSYLEKQKYKLVVLVNENSASASEIFSGAVQDTKAGTLVGTKTYGKARVQNILPILSPEAYEKYEKQLGVKVVDAYELESKYKVSFSDDEIIGWTKITTGQYTTPKGRMIDKKGLDPDIYVDDYKVTDDIDVNGIQKLAKIAKTGLNGESLDVYNAEKILKLSGYDVDTPDTKLDEKTFEAIGKFQKDSGLFPCGILDFTTQQALNDKLDMLVKNIDGQYDKAVEILKNE